MRRLAAPKLGAYAALAAAGLFVGLALGRPELVVLGAAFALAAGVGLTLERPPLVSIDFALERERAVEGDELTATVQVRGLASIDRLDLLLRLPAGIRLVDGDNPVALRLGSGESRTFSLRLLCERWGGYSIGDFALEARSGLGLHVFRGTAERRLPLRVYPGAEALRRLVPPLETQVFVGNRVARAKGEGIEFADIRPFGPGDRVRRINWRASARRGDLWVNESHPERNTDVILFLDTFVNAGGDGRGTINETIRAAASLIHRYLAHKDRVGLVSFGGFLNWLVPESGVRQLYRIVDALLDTEVILAYAWKDVDVIPVRVLPAKALVLALTPLLDDRAISTLLELRGRGFDLAIVEVSPLPFVTSGPTEPDRLAHRIWMLQREALRARYERAGVPVVVWRSGDSLAAALEEVAAFRRNARVARV